jgi:SHS2 domain-containing protein
MSYEFLEHTADIIIRATGRNLQEAFEQAAMGFYDVITNIEQIDHKETKIIEVAADDKENLLYNWISGLIFLFDTELFISNKIEIMKFEVKKENEEMTLSAKLVGESFEIGKHDQETEVKAMTYSFMKIGDKTVEFTLDL